MIKNMKYCDNLKSIISKYISYILRCNVEYNFCASGSRYQYAEY